MPLSTQVRNLIVFLSLTKSGLFQVGVKVDIAKVELVTLKNFNQAVRVEAIVIALKYG